MDFDYADYFGKVPSTGYETLLYDAMIGDATLFQRADMVEAGWSMVQPILDVWKALPPRSFPNYAAGSWGPAEADELLRRDGPPLGELGDVIVAGDIGGTNARLATFEVHAGQLLLTKEIVYPSRSAPDLETIVRRFVERGPAGGHAGRRWEWPGR